MPEMLFAGAFVPPEFLAAGGFAPRRLIPQAAAARRSPLPEAEVCPWLRALAGEIAAAGGGAAGAVLGATCDQMRRAGEELARLPGAPPVFLFAVPAGFSPAAWRLYRGELDRLGRFLARQGGRDPDDAALAAAAGDWDGRRRRLREAAAAAARPANRTPLALVGGPLFAGEGELLAGLAAAAGGAIVLDASEDGERGLPAAFDRRRLAAWPRDELCRAYFGEIPDAFRRPNDLLYRWLRDKLDERGVRGLLLRLGPWCDHWRGEARRLREWAGRPALELAPLDDEGAARLAGGRLQAFLEACR